MKILPWNRALTDFDIIKIVKKTPLINTYFRGVFSRDEITLSLKQPRKVECSIINLDVKEGTGTHWTAYFKSGNNVYYYDSFGNLPPPKELVAYFSRGEEIFYNRNQDQEFNSIICGHLCLYFLYKIICLYENIL